MATALIARQRGDWLIVCLAPNVNLTPMGSIPVPVPYPAVANLQAAIHTTSTVMVNGVPAVVFDASCVPITTGGEAGVLGGVMSGTVAQSTWPMLHSGTVKFKGKNIVRANDMFWMNGSYPGQEP